MEAQEPPPLDPQLYGPEYWLLRQRADCEAIDALLASLDKNPDPPADDP